MPFISKEEYRNIAKMQGLSNKNSSIASSSSGKNRKKGKGKAKGTAKAVPNAASVFSIEAAIDAAIAEANQAKQHQQASEPDVNSTAMDKENAVPNENVVHGFPLLGKPRRSFIGTKTTTTSTMMAAVAMPWFAVAASATAGVVVVATGDDDEVEDINGVPTIDTTDGNSLESLSPYSKSPCRPTSSGGSSDSSSVGQPSSAMKYSTMSSTYNVMGATSDATLTPRTLELSAVLDCLSFDFSSQNTMADEVVTGDETVPEEDLMPSITDTFSPSSSINGNVTITTTFDVAQTLYFAVKDVWANGKHIPVICSLFNITETVAAKVLDQITSSSGGAGTKEMVLLDIDERVIKPQLKRLDEKIVSPTITEVFKVIELIVSKADELVIAPIIKGLILFDRKEKDADVKLI